MAVLRYGFGHNKQVGRFPNLFLKSVVCNHSFSYRQLLVPQNYAILAFLTEVKKVSSTLP